MTLKAYGHYVLIKELEPSSKYRSSIIDLKVPDQYIKRTNQGIVVQVGSEVKYVQVGDYIPFEELRGEGIRTGDGTEFHLIHEDSITCKIVLEEEEVEGLFHQAEGTRMGGRYDEMYFKATVNSIIDCLVAHYSNKPRVVQEYKEIR